VSRAQISYSTETSGTETLSIAVQLSGAHGLYKLTYCCSSGIMQWTFCYVLWRWWKAGL